MMDDKRKLTLAESQHIYGRNVPERTSASLPRAVTVHEIGCSCGWKSPVHSPVSFEEAQQLMNEHASEKHDNMWHRAFMTWDE